MSREFHSCPPSPEAAQMLRDCKVMGSVQAIAQERPARQPEEGAPGARARLNLRLQGAGCTVWPGGVAGGGGGGGPLARAQEATVVQADGLVVVDPRLTSSSKLTSCPPERESFPCGSYTSIKTGRRHEKQPEAASRLSDGARLLQLLKPSTGRAVRSRGLV